MYSECKKINILNDEMKNRRIQRDIYIYIK